MNNNLKFFVKIIMVFIWLIFSYFLTILAIDGINNPDFEAYRSLNSHTRDYDFNLEPTFSVISNISRIISSVFFIDSVYILYYFYISLISVFLFLSFRKASDSLWLSICAVIVWYISYGLMHGLIQIRFGLANAIFLYVFLSLNFYRISVVKKYGFSLIGIFTHYSTIFEFLVSSLNLLKRNKYVSIHIFFITTLILFKMGTMLSFLPPVLVSRLSGYVNENTELSIVSPTLSMVSFFCYIFLVMSPKLNSVELNNLKYYGALSFLPYFIVPEYEILIRLGVGFQYLLIPYLLLTFKFKKALPTTLLLVSFISYKIYSALIALGSYL